MVASKRPWLKRKMPGAAGGARAPPTAANGAAGAAGANRPGPVTKEGKKLCSNCGETGHHKTECKQPKVDFSKRKCFSCNKTGHSSHQCPTKGDVRILQEEEGVEDEVGFMLEESTEDLYWANAHRQQYRLYLRSWITRSKPWLRIQMEKRPITTATTTRRMQAATATTRMTSLTSLMSPFGISPCLRA